MQSKKQFTKGLCVVITGCLLAAPAIPAMAAETTIKEEVITDVKTEMKTIKTETPVAPLEMKGNLPSEITIKTSYKMSTEWSDKFESGKVLSHITLKDGTEVVMNDTKDGIIYNEADCKFNESGTKAITPDGQSFDLSFYYQTALYDNLYRPLYKDENGHYYISLSKMDESGFMCYEYVFLEITKDSETNAISEVFTTSEAVPMSASISDLNKEEAYPKPQTDSKPKTDSKPVTTVVSAKPVKKAAPVVTSSTSEQQEVDPYAGYDPTPALELMKKLAAAAATNAKPATTAVKSTAVTATKSTAATAKPATTKSDSANKHSSLPPKKSLISADTSDNSAVTDVATPLETNKPAKDNTDGITVVAADAYPLITVEKDNLVLLGIIGIIIALSIPTFICVNKFLFRRA